MTQYLVRKNSELSRDNSLFCLTGFFGTATAGQISTLEWQIQNEHWLTGGSLVCEGQKFGDIVDFYVVIKDGQGNDLASVQFAKQVVIGLGPVSINEGLEYVALIPPGAYFRAVYTSTGLVNVNLGVNLRLHRPKDTI